MVTIFFLLVETHYRKSVEFSFRHQLAAVFFYIKVSVIKYTFWSHYHRYSKNVSKEFVIEKSSEVCRTDRFEKEYLALLIEYALTDTVTDFKPTAFPPEILNSAVHTICSHFICIPPMFFKPSQFKRLGWAFLAYNLFNKSFILFIRRC